jgi:hypothetical protein
MGSGVCFPFGAFAVATVRRGVVVLAAAVVLAGVSATSAAARPAEVANPFTTSTSRVTDIHFVPLDPHARQLLTATVPTVKRYLRWPTETTAIPSSKKTWIHVERQQADGRAIMRDLLSRFTRAQGNRQSALILVTGASVYDSMSPQFGFVFGAYGVPGVSPKSKQVVAIVGTGPMRVYHPEREKARLTKMMLRYVGELICGLPRNSNRKSVMYSPIVSDADLDRMRATLPGRC